jgi:hypothetical protein
LRGAHGERTQHRLSSTPRNQRLYLEATITGKAETEQAADIRRNRIYHELNKLRVADFMLSIEIESPGTAELRKVGDLRRQLKDWLGTLDPDAAERRLDAIGEGPTFSWSDDTAGHWSLRLFQASRSLAANTQHAHSAC